MALVHSGLFGGLLSLFNEIMQRLYQPTFNHGQTFLFCLFKVFYCKSSTIQLTRITILKWKRMD